ncbi:hypothetical protein [Actinorhabdospora filicis]|uniref:hypothetical protein n=1 Tax=Actinorhabdospora filicis TaxID=1785913 RepID=UPI0025571BA3|nr:hypothetical protein [Actinorhabdospora filicis]
MNAVLWALRRLTRYLGMEQVSVADDGHEVNSLETPRHRTNHPEAGGSTWF